MNKAITLAAIMLLAAVYNSNGQVKETKTESSSEKKSEEREPCKSFLYSDSFEAVYIRSTACGSLSDVELVYGYVDGKCTKTQSMVDMSKYIRMDEEDTCKDGLKVCRYERIKNK